MIVRVCQSMSKYAQVVELVDTLALGASAKSMRVRVSPWAPKVAGLRSVAQAKGALRLFAGAEDGAYVKMMHR